MLVSWNLKICHSLSAEGILLSLSRLTSPNTMCRATAWKNKKYVIYIYTYIIGAILIRQWSFYFSKLFLMNSHIQKPSCCNMSSSWWTAEELVWKKEKRVLMVLFLKTIHMKYLMGKKKNTWKQKTKNRSVQYLFLLQYQKE